MPLMAKLAEPSGTQGPSLMSQVLSLLSRLHDVIYANYAGAMAVRDCLFGPTPLEKVDKEMQPQEPKGDLNIISCALSDMLRVSTMSGENLQDILQKINHPRPE